MSEFCGVLNTALQKMAAIVLRTPLPIRMQGRLCDLTGQPLRGFMVLQNRKNCTDRELNIILCLWL